MADLPTEEGTVELKACPFCGKENTAKVTRASELWNEDEEGYPFPHSDSFAVMCDASKPGGPGGCGGACGYCETEADAIAAWNRRASRSPVVGAVGGEPTRWHELKTDPDVFDAVASGAKTHEIRFNDRNFKVGDGLLLRKTRNSGWAMKNTGAPLEYTGEEERRVVSHVLEGYGLESGWVILSFASPTAAGPMTEERIDAVVEKLFPPDRDSHYKRWLQDIARPIARAIEAAHGIGVSPTGTQPYGCPAHGGAAHPCEECAAEVNEINGKAGK